MSTDSAAAAAPAIAAIVVNYNAGDELRAALESIARELAGRRWHGIVVDNASHDGSAPIALEFAPAVALVSNAANVAGAAGATQRVDISWFA